MKSLSTYLECDGAATPATTIGMGNPAAPGPDGSPGSGDTFDHQKAKAKKEKRRKSDKDVRWDKKPESLQAFMEGILDVDLDVAEDDIRVINFYQICDKAVKNNSRYTQVHEDLVRLLGTPVKWNVAKKAMNQGDTIIHSDFSMGISTIGIACYMRGLNPNNRYPTYFSINWNGSSGNCRYGNHGGLAAKCREIGEYKFRKDHEYWILPGKAPMQTIIDHYK